MTPDVFVGGRGRIAKIAEIVPPAGADLQAPELLLATAIPVCSVFVPSLFS